MKHQNIVDKINNDREELNIVDNIFIAFLIACIILGATGYVWAIYDIGN